MRIGHGYDVHRLVEGRKLILGGVEIPFEKGLDGHSDADVLVHAVMDALLGAAALGDIGSMGVWVLRISLAVPSQAATKQLSDIYSSRMKKSSASNTLLFIVSSPSTSRLQNTSLGYQPVLALIWLKASATVSPRLSICTA